MTTLQFRILYREFLFRMVDLELLSADAQGDANKLLGRLAAVLVLFSVGLGLAGLMFDGKSLTAEQFRATAWSTEHFLISTTMLVVGLFAVLSWDSTFPDKRDVLVLAPLPVSTRTLFLAKVAAVATGLSLAVGVLNVGPGLSWPVTLSSANPGFFDLLLPFAHRTFAAYWITMFAAGTFLFCCVLSVQGLAALLPRRIFLRLSAVLQMAVFCLCMSVYFLQPQPAMLGVPGAPKWLPSWWFLGLFQQLNGTATTATEPLARRAWIGLATAIATTAAAYAFSYFRTLRKIVEEPDIAPGTRGGRWSPRFGTSVQTAIVLFSIRAVSRSRQHRVILAFYLGVGFAFVILMGRSTLAQRQLLTLVSVPRLMAGVVMLAFCVLGTRVIFGMPIDLRANWVFRMMPLRAGAETQSAARRALYVLALAPVGIALTAWYLWIWPWQYAAGHLAVLVLLGALLIETVLFGFRKIPFTCSWLPGKSHWHLALVGFVSGLQALLFAAVEYERSTLQEPARYFRMVAVLGIVFATARWCAVRTRSDEPVVQFEETETPALQGLGLFRDGVLPPQASGR